MNDAAVAPSPHKTCLLLEGGIFARLAAEGCRDLILKTPFRDLCMRIVVAL
jgi:hypothetical protein